MTDFLFCDRCKTGFARADADTEREFVTNDPYPIYEETLRCPFCGGDDFEDAEECAYCGEIFPTDKMDSCVCRECRGEIDKRLLDVVMKNFDKHDAEIVKDLYCIG